MKVVHATSGGLSLRQTHSKPRTQELLGRSLSERNSGLRQGALHFQLPYSRAQRLIDHRMAACEHRQCSL